MTPYWMKGKMGSIEEDLVPKIFDYKNVDRKSKEFSVETHMSLIGLKKAFDKVDRNKLL